MCAHRMGTKRSRASMTDCVPDEKLGLISSSNKSDGRTHAVHTLLHVLAYAYCPASLLLAASYATFVVSGMLSVATPPAVQTEAGGVSIPTHAVCHRATRRADYTEVHIGIGKPTVQTKVLLRLDHALAHNKTASGPALRLFASRAMHSSTVSCDTAGVCQDVALIPTGLQDSMSTHIVRFAYAHPSSEAATGTYAYRLPGIEGELFLRRGMAYWLTSTHLCHSSSRLAASGDANLHRLHVSASSRLHIGVATLQAHSDMLRRSPLVGVNFNESCLGDDYAKTVRLFPVDAVSESAWLSLPSAGLLNTNPRIVFERRSVVELGTECALQAHGLKQASNLYELDCAAYGRCWRHASLPFRRASTLLLHIALSEAGDGNISMSRDASLGQLPGLADSADAFAVSLVKLALVVLATAVVFVRAAKAESHAYSLFEWACSAAGHSSARSAVTEDGILSFVAFAARAAVAWYRFGALSANGQVRVCVTEAVAAGLSFVHWTLRRLPFASKRNDSCRYTLGGSAATVDASCAVMMAFAHTPVTGATLATFDLTARMLISVLIASVVATRVVFSASSCGVMLQRELSIYLHAYAAASWLFQSAALGIIVADLFVTPAGYSMSRNIPGSMQEAQLLLFVVLTCCGLPQVVLLATALAASSVAQSV